MFSSLRLSHVVAAGMLIAGVAVAQNIPNNNHDLNNGTDIVYIYGDPSIGAPPGFVNLSGDLWWRVYPKDSLISATGTLEVPSFDWEIYDTDWTTSAVMFDTGWGPGVNNTAFPGNIAPDFSSAGLAATIFVGGGSTGFANPCSISTAFCSGSVCPPPGFVVGYLVNSTFYLSGTACDGSTGIVLTTNGTVDNVITAFLPDGMTFASGAPGQCGMGDYSLMTAASTDEQQADALVTGYSQFGGFQLGATPQMNPDATTENSAFGLEFCDIAMNTVAGDTGLAGLEYDTTLSAAFGYDVRDLSGVGLPNLTFASSCILAPFPAPGINLFGAQVMLNLTDPTVTATLKKGTAVLQDPLAAGYPFNYGQFTNSTLVIPPTAGGLGIKVTQQGITISLATLIARGSFLTKCRLN